MIKANFNKVIKTSVLGEISHPHMGAYGVGSDGSVNLAIGMSGILYNVNIGDPAFGWPYGDHVEPGVSIRNEKGRTENNGLNILACIGNKAIIITASMDKKIRLKTGTVTGFHGGVERVMVHFKKEILEKLCVGDKILIKAEGLGLQINGFDDVKIMNTSPQLLKSLNIKTVKGKLQVPVKMTVPATIMGSGLGSGHSISGDYDIQSNSPKDIKRLGLDKLLLGDIIAIQDHDNSYGPRYKKGSITIGSIAHGSSTFSGHGPGVNVLLTCSSDKIKPVISQKANLKNLLKL